MMNLSVNSLISSIVWEFSWIIIAFILGSLLTLFFEKKIRIRIRTMKYKLFPKDFRFNLFFKYYFTTKINDLDSEVFNKIKDKFIEYEIRKSKVKPESITINPEKLGNKVNIYLDSTNELQEGEEVSEDDADKYNEFILTIKLDSNLWISYNRLDIMQDYIVLFNGIKEIVRDYCFNGESPSKSFLVCDIIRDINKITNLDKIEDSSKKLKVSFVENNIKIVLNEPIYLMTTIKKYIGY